MVLVMLATLVWCSPAYETRNTPGTTLFNICNKNCLFVNSGHGQSICRRGAMELSRHWLGHRAHFPDVLANRSHFLRLWLGPRAHISDPQLLQ